MRTYTVLLRRLRSASCGAGSVRITRPIRTAITSLTQLLNERRGMSDHRTLTSIQPIKTINQALSLIIFGQFSLLLAVTINPVQSKPAWKIGSRTPPASLSPPSTPSQVSMDLDATQSIHRVGIHSAHDTLLDFLR